LTSGPGFPVRDLLNILQFPERDHSAAQQRYRSRVDDSFNWMWSPDLKRFRQSPEFKQLIEELGLQVYWRSDGFPPQCRPLGENDFECD